ncbi:MAG: hypothetical protein WD226_07375 [Planctomycetota bacterium]
MKLRRSLAVFSTSLVALLAATSCSIVPEARGALRYQLLEPSGDLAASSGGGSSSTSLDRLGLGDREELLSPRADVSWGPVDLMVSAFDLSASGSGEVDGTYELGGVTIPAGESVDSDLDLTHVSALMTWDLVPTDLIDIGIGFGVAYIDFDVTLDGEFSGTARTAEEVPIPVLALRAEVDLGPVTGNLHVSGMSIDIDDVDAMYLDADAFVAYRFSELLGVEAQLQVGYRHVELEFDYDDGGSNVDGELELSGVYFGLAVGF